MGKITIFTSKNCGPCRRVEELVRAGKYPGEVELVDIETDEGFERFKSEVLSEGDGAVPSAYKGGQRCLILANEEEIDIQCPVPAPEASQAAPPEEPTG